jgi:hypothetical protein
MSPNNEWIMGCAPLTLNPYTRDLVLLLHSSRLLETMEVLIKNMLKFMKELTN